MKDERVMSELERLNLWVKFDYGYLYKQEGWLVYQHYVVAKGAVKRCLEIIDELKRQCND